MLKLSHAKWQLLNMSRFETIADPNSERLKHQQELTDRLTAFEAAKIAENDSPPHFRVLAWSVRSYESKSANFTPASSDTLQKRFDNYSRIREHGAGDGFWEECLIHDYRIDSLNQIGVFQNREPQATYLLIPGGVANWRVTQAVMGEVRKNVLGREDMEGVAPVQARYDEGLVETYTVPVGDDMEYREIYGLPPEGGDPLVVHAELTRHNPDLPV